MWRGPERRCASHGEQGSNCGLRDGVGVPGLILLCFNVFQAKLQELVNIVVDACAVGNLEVVIALASRMGMAILTQAENYIKVEEVGVNGGKTALHAAAAGGSVDVMRYLVEVGVPVDVLAAGGRTPLWLAAGEGAIEAMHLLLKLGADVDKANNNDATPVFIGTHPTPQNDHSSYNPTSTPSNVYSARPPPITRSPRCNIETRSATQAPP